RRMISANANRVTPGTWTPAERTSSERRVHRPAVDDEVLPDDEARVGAAQEGACLAEFVRRAEAARRILGDTRGEERVVVLASFRCQLAQAVGLPLREERSGQQVVDRDVVPCHLPRESGNEARQP